MTPLPIAARRPHTLTQHGQTRIDNYYWLREKDDPETVKHLQAESDYFKETMQHTERLQEALFSEMKARIKEEDASTPEKKGDYLYYSRVEKGKQYPIFCRRKGSMDSAEEILLDQNLLADGRTFCSIAAFTVSPDGDKLAYSIDYDGNEIYTLQIKNLVTGALYPEAIGNTFGSVYEYGGVEWGNDSETLYYVTLDEALRGDKLFKHSLGTDPAEDELLLHEKDVTFFIYITKTRDDAYILVHHYGTITREMHFLSADKPGILKVIQPRIEGLEYSAAHHKGNFLIVNNDGAKNFKLSIAPVETPGREAWREVIPHREDVMLEFVETFEDHVVLLERRGGLRQIRVSAPDCASNVRYVQFPEKAYEVLLKPNPEFDSKILRFDYASFITPATTVDYHMQDGEWEVKKVQEVPGGYDKSQYASERIHAAAADGTRIPISLVYRKNMVHMDGRNPILIYAYGAYGSIIDATFNPAYLSLLDRGFIYGVAHVRGGADLGRDWYDNGRLLNKRNSFTDLIACIEHLIAAGYTEKERTAIWGVSAGGLLVGACTTMRPDLFGAVVCKVPFVDVITSMSDPTVPLTTLEYDQWGDPRDRECHDYMMSYSPYDNLRATDYPRILITTGLKDPRVAYWEPLKFAAKMRELKTDDHPVLVYINFDSGHAGASGRFDSLRETALDYAFLIDALGAPAHPEGSTVEK